MNTVLSEDRKKFFQQDYSKGFVAFCGLEAVEVGAGALESRVRIKEEHRQQDGFIHAGLIGRQDVDYHGVRARVGIDEKELKKSSEQPASAGGPGRKQMLST
ncbi:MAG: hypothetical protein HY788_13860 [Deltaproteobacteria bacterium]|nr:hypothetical protein [Deltaproteobacteria bacterium]